MPPRTIAVTMTVAIASTLLSVLAAVLAACAIHRLRFKGSNWLGLAIYLAYLVSPSILSIRLASMVFQFDPYDSPLALILQRQCHVRSSAAKSAA